MRLEVRREVARALEEGRPVVALESALLTHGLPAPRNLETARAMEAAVREEGAVPATIAVLDGRLVVGLSDGELDHLATAADVTKVSRADLGPALASGGPGATTVAATLFAAHRAGIPVLATGGIGGVHRGAERSLDVSADLAELARAPAAVVCSGAKAILDLPRTLELLETLGVAVVGYGTGELPAFYARASGLPLAHRVDEPDEAARLMAAHWGLGLSSSILFACPPPAASALPLPEIERHLAAALERAEREGVRGKALTPFLLAELARESGGRALEANVALLIGNARTAARIAAAYAAGSASRT